MNRIFSTLLDKINFNEKKMKLARKIIFSLVSSVLIVILLNLSLFFSMVTYIDDEFYQQNTPPNPEIVIIGMDVKAIAAYDSMPWPRDIMADAIEVLNSNPDKKPAVIGIDTLYTTTDNSDADKQLVDIVREGGNVVTASNITFESKLVMLPDGGFYMDENAVSSFEEPFLALAEVSVSGHINAMLDNDGILRHAIWEVTLPNGDKYPSFNQVIYNEYMKSIGADDLSVPVTDSDGFWYLKYSSYPGSYSDGYSIVDLIEGKLDPDIFADKIVLIGPYTIGMSDEYFTAIDHASKMFGVEYQANAIAALLNGDLKDEIDSDFQWILLFALTFTMSFLLYDRKFSHATIFFIAVSALWFFGCLLLFELGYVMHISYFLLSALICYSLSIIINYLGSLIEKRRITSTFKRFLAPDVVTELLNDEDASSKLGGKLTDIVVLFADIRGFTSLSEELSPAEVAEVLNEYLTMMSESVLKTGGTIDKFMGDSIMAFWGAPLKTSNFQYKAAVTAFDIIVRSKELEDKFMARFGRRIKIGIGINYGPCIVGNFGSVDRMDYTAIGDTVNVTARLESNAKPGTILATKNFVESISDKVDAVSLGDDIELKGKSQKIEIYRLLKLKE